MSATAPGLFENRQNFLAPDSGPHRTPYACSFHWLRMPDDGIIGLDLVRSDDLNRRALRVFEISPAGEIRSLVLESDSSDWAPFSTESIPSLKQTKPVLARGENWVAGAASAEGQSISAVAFEFRLNPLRLGKGTGEAGLLVAHLNAMDYTETETSGWIEIDGSRTEFEANLGPASIHFGDFLPDYAWAATVPKPGVERPQILVNAIDAEDLKIGASLLENRSLIYGYGSAGLPGLFVATAELEQGAIPLGEKPRLELANIKAFDHTLLGRHTVTATAEASYVPDPVVPDEMTYVGQVMLDFRGENYARLLSYEL